MEKSTEWMTVKHAARLWHVSERTARRYFDDLGAPFLRVSDENGKYRLRRVVPIGTAPPLKVAGNPQFRQPEYQSELSGRRWDGHITPEMRQGYEAAMFELQRERILSGIELGMPPERDDEDE